MPSRPSATLAPFWTTTPDAASWGPPLMYHVGEKVARLPTETNPMSPSLSSRDPSKNRPCAMPEIVRTVSKILEHIWQGRIGLRAVLVGACGSNARWKSQSTTVGSLLARECDHY